MKRIHILIILAALVVAIIIFEPFRMEPPTPEVTVNGEEIPTTQGSYCWHGILFAQCVDFIHTSPIDMAREHSPAKVAPREKIKIEYYKKPIEGTLKVDQWVDETNSKSIELKDDSFIVPEEKGIYVYHIISNWKQGDGNYAFSIEVE